jgi:aerobic C4-dicarboxylate transport protein
MPSQAAAVPSRKRKIYRHLYFQVLCAIAIGVLLGHFLSRRWALG